jgi:hypothetical protein
VLYGAHCIRVCPVAPALLCTSPKWPAFSKGGPCLQRVPGCASSTQRPSQRGGARGGDLGTVAPSGGAVRCSCDRCSDVARGWFRTCTHTHARSHTCTLRHKGLCVFRSRHLQHTHTHTHMSACTSAHVCCLAPNALLLVAKVSAAVALL